MKKQEVNNDPIILKARTIVVPPPNLQDYVIRITGTAPYCQLRFGEKAKWEMMKKMEEEQSNIKKKKVREPRNYQEEYDQSMYKTDTGQFGINSSSFRNSMIASTKILNYQTTKAKLSIFVLADGYDFRDLTPLTFIYGEPKRYESPVRVVSSFGKVSTDIRIRAIWHKWYADVHVQFDDDQFHIEDVVNLLNRAGQQVGIGEGRPNSRDSYGTGFGTFVVANGDIAK